MKFTIVISLTLISLIFCRISIAQSQVNGYVFEDVNHNGEKERKEKGIQGVAVSNGTEVVQTDASGRYQLPVANDNIIFVIKPSGYQISVFKKNIPQFFYIHKPFGSPANFTYKGTAPTGKLPASVNFGLVPNKESDEYTALIFGDPQPYSVEEVDFFDRGVVNEVAGIKDVSFGISLGDLVGDNLDMHQLYINVMEKAGVPWYNVIGNHDINWMEPIADSVSDESFEAHFGPANYSFNYGRVHFIILDDVLHPRPDGRPATQGGFRKDQLDFVENDLKFVDKNNLVVLSFHIPLQTRGEDFRASDRQRLFDLLKDFPYTLSLSAHTHLQRQNFYTTEDGWRQVKPHHEYNAGTTSGDWYSGELDEKGIPYSTMRDGTPKGYAFINFKGNQYTIDYKVAGKPKDYRMHILMPEVVPNSWNTGNFYVNFFMGTRGDSVRCRIDDGEWEGMDWVAERDAGFLNLLHRWDYTEEIMPGRRPGTPSISTHLWKSAIPDKLSLGNHVLEVEVKDMFGRTFRQKTDFTVQESKAIRPRY